MATPPDNLSKDIAKLKAEASFVRANWTKLSLIIVGALIVGAIIGRLL